MSISKKDIIFIGGIHGVGKSTICKDICKKFQLEYLSASELIKWSDINEDHLEKEVSDINMTQNRLLEGLKRVSEKGGTYLLDGHFCLLNAKQEVVPVPFQTFQNINPVLAGVIVGDVGIIRDRIQSRDGKSYEYGVLNELQLREQSYAAEVSDKLGVKLCIGKNDDPSGLISRLKVELGYK